MTHPRTIRLNVTHSQYVLFDTDAEPPLHGGGDLVHGNGLVTVNAAGTYAEVTTGTSYGQVDLTFTADPAAPPPDTDPWDDVVEVSVYFSGQGPMAGGPLSDDLVDLPLLGQEDDYRWWRLRVHASGRDAAQAEGDLVTEPDAPCLEQHLIQAWPAEPAPAHEHKLTDHVGRLHREAGRQDGSAAEPPTPQTIRAGELTVDLNAQGDDAR